MGKAEVVGGRWWKPALWNQLARGAVLDREEADSRWFWRRYLRQTTCWRVARMAGAGTERGHGSGERPARAMIRGSRGGVDGETQHGRRIISDAEANALEERPTRAFQSSDRRQLADPQ